LRNGSQIPEKVAQMEKLYNGLLGKLADSQNEYKMIKTSD